MADGFCLQICTQSLSFYCLIDGFASFSIERSYFFFFLDKLLLCCFDFLPQQTNCLGVALVFASDSFLIFLGFFFESLYGIFLIP